MNTRPIFFLLAFQMATAVFAQKTEVSADSFFQRGLEAHQTAALDDAIGFYTAALARNEDHSAALFNRAMAYFSKSQFQKSGRDLDAFLRLEPKDRDALERRGYVSFLLKNYEEAEKFYSHALAIAESARLFANRGIARFDKGDPEKALEDFQSALRTDDNLTEAWLGAGNAWLMMGDFKKAESIFGEAIRRGNDDPELLYNLGISLAKMGKYPAAVVQLDKALAIREDAATLAQRAFCYFKLGKLKEAAADAERANNLDIRVAYSYHTLGLLALRDKKFAAAEKFFSEGLAWEPENAELLAARGFSKYKIQNLSAALEDLDAAIEIDPNSGEAFYTRAAVKHVSGQQLEACTDYRKAVELGYEPFTEEDGSPFCEGVLGKMEPKK